MENHQRDVLPNSRLKRVLAEGQVAVGCLLAYDAPWLVEVLGITGYDFVTVDLEHEAIDDSAVANLIRAASGVGLSSLVRMPATPRLFPFLSAGVAGVQVPDLRGKSHAEEVVELTRFPPLGRRTYYTQTRSARYGVGIDESTWPEWANENLIVIGMIEDVGILDELDEILAVEGIDAYHVGTLDLAQSMGDPGPDRVEEVVSEIVSRCRQAGKYTAVGVVTPWGVDSVAKRVSQGIQIVNIASAWVLTDAIGSFLRDVERRIPSHLRRPSAQSVSPNPYVASSAPHD